MNIQETVQQSIQSNNILIRDYLHQKEREGLSFLDAKDQVRKCYSFLRIQRISRDKKEIGNNYRQLQMVLIGLSQEGCSFSYLIKGTKEGLAFYLVCPSRQQSVLEQQYRSAFVDVDLECVNSPFEELFLKHNGLVVGHPKVVDDKQLSLYSLCLSLLGLEFSILITATRYSTHKSSLMIRNLDYHLEKVGEQVGRSLSMGKSSIQLEFPAIKNYQISLESYRKLYQEGVATGLWETQVCLSGNQESTYELLTQLFRSQYTEQENRLESLKILPIKVNSEQIGVPWQGYWEDELRSNHPVNIGRNNHLSLYRYFSHTLLTSHQLTSYIQLPEYELPGFAIDETVHFETAQRRKVTPNSLKIGNIINKGRQLYHPYEINIHDLNRHVLLVGMTGAGKTNTSKSILYSLWKMHTLPFLVIESAKREYWDLANVLDTEEFQVFTLGEESKYRGVPFRLNPFEVIGTASIQAHIDRLFAAFKASFDLVPPTPFILEQALYEIYEDSGWDIISNENFLGKATYPTLSDLLVKIDELVKHSGYTGEVESNIKASLRARIQSLRLGGKGMMLDVETSFPIDRLLYRPTVLELEDLGDDATKSFVIGLLLNQLYEYRQAHQAYLDNHSFEHLLVIEEAHRLLSKEQKGENSKAKAIEFFTNLLAEIRSFGQGIFISDQIPTKLASDTLKNTNLKIVHRTVAKEDRDAIGDSMNMTSEQKDFLSHLKIGVAAVYSEGDHRPKLVRFPQVKSSLRKGREAILELSYASISAYYPKERKRIIPDKYRLMIEEMPLNRQAMRTFVETDGMEKFCEGYLIGELGISEHQIELMEDCLGYALQISRFSLADQKEYLAHFRKVRVR